MYSAVPTSVIVWSANPNTLRKKVGTVSLMVTRSWLSSPETRSGLTTVSAEASLYPFWMAMLCAEAKDVVSSPGSQTTPPRAAASAAR